MIHSRFSPIFFSANVWKCFVPAMAIIPNLKPKNQKVFHKLPQTSNISDSKSVFILFSRTSPQSLLYGKWSPSISRQKHLNKKAFHLLVFE